MNKILRNKLVVGVLVVGLVGLGITIAGDVIVQNGHMDVEGNLDVDSDLYVSGSLDADYGSFSNVNVDGDVTAGDDLNVGGHLDVDDGLAVWGYTYITGDVEVYFDIGYSTRPNAYLGSILGTDVAVSSHGVFGDDIFVCGKVNTWGGVDPPYILCDRQTRSEIVEKVRQEVPVDKQGGAALFFNKDTDRLEAYVATEGKFYDLQGSVVGQMPKVEPAAIPYENRYLLDTKTGQPMKWHKPICDRYALKAGFTLDERSGQFVNTADREILTREQALELHSAADGKVYDLQGNFLRMQTAQEPTEYRKEYYLDPLTGEVKVRQRPVRDMYVVKKGYRLNSQTGQFVNTATGQVVAKEQAVEIRKTAQ